MGCDKVYGREYILAKDIIKTLKKGDAVMAKVLDLENEDGYVELSLRDAGKDIVWREADELMKKKEVLELEVLEANKGGLVLEWKKIKGFLPASQLKTSHYPRVEGGDKERIFSEKGADATDLALLTSKYQIGQVIEGEITGVVDFGVFIKLEEGLEGL